MLTEVLNADVEFVEQPFVRPLQLSSGTITRTPPSPALRDNGWFMRSVELIRYRDNSYLNP